MMPASIVMAAALAAWGAVAPAVESAPSDVAPPATTVPPATRVPAAIHVPIIAKAPVNVRAAQALDVAPRGGPEPRPPLYKDWRFWVIAGGVFVATVIITIAETRPGPASYTGNAPPYYIGFP
jgi:hypothetical protein